MGITIDGVFSDLVAESEVQRQQFTEKHDDSNSHEKWLMILNFHLGMAGDGGRGFDEERYERQLIRVGATVVSALASLRRNRARSKAIGKQPPGSDY